MEGQLTPRKDLYIIPEGFHPYTHLLMERNEKDEVPMVRWYLATLVANVLLTKEETDEELSLFLHLPDDESTFVKSRAIVNPCVLGQHYETCKGFQPELRLSGAS